MGKKRIFLFAVAGIFLAGFAWLLLTPREPVYQGKTLTAWLKEASASQVWEFEDANPAAVNAIRQIGTNGLPEMIRLITTTNSTYKRLLWALNEQLPFPQDNALSQEQAQMMVGSGFYILGPAAKPAIQDLMVLLTNADPNATSLAAGCLGLIGPLAAGTVPNIIEAEKSGHLNFYSAAFALRKMGPAAKAGVPFLLQLSTTSAHPEIDAALIEIGNLPVSPTIDQLKETSNATNWLRAAMVVEMCPDKGESAVPLLIAALKETNTVIVSTALRVLRVIHRSHDLCIPAIVPLLNSPDQFIRYRSLEALESFRVDAKSATPEIIRLLSDPEAYVRTTATNALRSIDPEAAAKAGVK